MPISDEKKELLDEFKEMLLASESGFIAPKKYIWHVKKAARIIAQEHGCSYEEALEAYPRYLVAIDPALRDAALIANIRQYAGILHRMHKLEAQNAQNTSE